MAKRTGFGVRPGARISAQQVALIAVSALALALMITALVAFNKSADLSSLQAEQRDKLTARYYEELSALSILVQRQETESGNARADTLHDMIKHIYAADALSACIVDAYGGEPLMTTDAYAQLNDLITGSLNQLQSGNDPDANLTEFNAALEELRQGGADA